MATIAAPLNFLGVNYYQPVHLRPGDPDNLRRNEEAPPVRVNGVVKYRPDGVYQPNSVARTAMDWLVDPEGLYELLLRLSKDAPGLPLYVTENGCAAEDYVNPEGAVNDVERVRFLHLHLAAAARAIRDGANLAGYYVWSLLDNFEWAWGYQKRFGSFVSLAPREKLCIWIISSVSSGRIRASAVLYVVRATEPNAGARVDRFGSRRICPSGPLETHRYARKPYYYALVLIVVALVAALFGFGGVASTAMGGAHLLIWVAVVVVVVGVVFALMRRA